MDVFIDIVETHMPHPDKLFSEEERRLLAEAVEQAEHRTSGEIVPYVVGRSDSYPEVWMRGGLLLAFAALFVFALLDIGFNVWLPFSMGEEAMITVLAFAVGAALAGFVPSVGRALLTAGGMQQRVDERAALAFLQEEVFATRDRTGILIMLSLYERRVRVMGDSGINAKVDQKAWDDMVAVIVRGMREGRPADGLIQAVNMCGALLAAHDVEIRPDDTNELGDELRISDR